MECDFSALRNAASAMRDTPMAWNNLRLGQQEQAKMRAVESAE